MQNLFAMGFLNGAKRIRTADPSHYANFFCLQTGCTAAILPVFPKYNALKDAPNSSK